jgi:predicted nucleotidyltransferase component of viral defense system
MKRKTPVNVSASVRARLLKVSKERREDFTLTLMNYAAERFLYRLSRSSYREQFVLKGAMLFAVRIGEPYRPTKDLDLLSMGEATKRPSTPPFVRLPRRRLMTMASSSM